MFKAVWKIWVFSIIVECDLCSPSHLEAPPLVKVFYSPPKKWRNIVRAPAEHLINLQIGLKPSSDQFRANYGQRLSVAEVNKFVKPTVQSTTLVEEWLFHHGISKFDYNPSREWIAVSLTIDIIERLLDAKYYIFRHEEDDETLIRTPAWSLPHYLHDHIEVIQPTNSFWWPKAQDKYGGVPQPAWEVEGRLPTHEELEEEDLVERGHLDIPDINDLPSVLTAEDARNRLAIFPLCLRSFYDAAAAKAAYTFETQIVAQGLDQQTPVTPEQSIHFMGFEGALDAETVLGVSYPTPLVAYNVGGRASAFKPSTYTPTNSNESYLEWLQYLLAQPTLPQVITISYADEEQSIPYSYAKRVCELFAQLRARGVLIIAASGDDGVGEGDNCFSNDGSDKPRWLPAFPASCPFVTSVGGTRFLNSELGEIAGWDKRGGFVSGGGFSNYFPRPKYQERAAHSH
ncbi:hypothetical protein OIDMADRAFT_60569 [Oidiodendron maius Zn]|uniref:Peptidase S53 domain-containing protein n=1 Tax=Oidiodendron maius (strain Zn) TaxID=913774 RepID=A0A0C3GFA6_OIDMZ|nr:hypothetical protein OIDMADRAFT_60569 [Oidiodendron maius Zn]